jgi:hypothetical protein
MLTALAESLYDRLLANECRVLCHDIALQAIKRHNTEPDVRSSKRMTFCTDYNVKNTFRGLLGGVNLFAKQ